MSDYEPNKVIPGTVYQVIRLIGQGGMGTVYEVEDTTVGKRYVLKTLHAELRTRKEIAARINKEARILARLSHPNIVEVVTAGVTGDSLRLPYFLMQKLNGHTLRSVLSAKGRLPLETAYSIAIDLLDALDHAHALGVIHRDVKPENIFLHRGPNETHQTKLLDFGVMRMLSSDQPQTGARFVGTLRYAPPEQLRGGQITPRTDLYAAGLVLYEMLAGGGPFDDQTTDRRIANAHLQKTPPPLSSRIRISPALEALVMSALAKDPAGRPRDAFTFAAALRELSGIAMSERPADLGSRTSTTAPVGLDLADGQMPFRDAATTMGAISSSATRLASQRRSVVAMAIFGLAVVIGGLALGSKWKKEHPGAPVVRNAASHAPTVPSATSATPAAASAVHSVPLSSAVLTATQAAPAGPRPRPAPTTHRQAPPDESARPRLPGPGF